MYYIVVYCIALYCIALYSTLLCCMALHRIALCSIAFYCVELCGTVSQSLSLCLLYDHADLLFTNYYLPVIIYFSLHQPNASMHHLRKATETFIEKYDSVMIVMNVGLHYLSNPVPRFSRPDYTVQITEALQYLHDKVTEFKGKKNIRVIWRETSAQHFPTSNGYWPGVKYAEEMDVKCVPIKDTREEADWRNKDANNIIIKNKFNISIAPFYKQTEPLWGMHVNGHLRDCTHLCWTPMLYQKLFHLLADFMMPSKEIIK